MAQMGFFDFSDRCARLNAKKDPPVEIDLVAPWEEFRPLLKQVWRKAESERKSNAGNSIHKRHKHLYFGDALSPLRLISS